MNKRIIFFFITVFIVISALVVFKFLKLDIEFEQENNSELLTNKWNTSVRNDKLIILTVWSNECIPCIKEIPILNSLNSKYKDSNVVFLSYNISKDKGKMFEILVNTKSNSIESSTIMNDYMSFFGKGKERNSPFQSEIIPKTFLIRNSNLIESKTGSLAESELDSLIRVNLY